MTQQDGPGLPVPGWYPDPWFHGQRRFWTGTGWSADAFPDDSGPAGVGPRWAAAGLGPPPADPATPPPPPPVWEARSPVAVAPAPLPPTEAGTRSSWQPAALVAAVVVGLVLAVVAGVALWPDGDAPAAAGAATAPARPSPSPSQPTPGPSDSAPTPGPSQSAPTPGPSQSAPTPGPSGSGRPPGASSTSLADLVVRQRDVPAGFVVLTIPGGDQVDGEVTLDLCETTYPSEALREERLQTAAITATGATTLSTEAVRYRSGAATAQAFAELRASAASCRGRSVKAGADTTWARTDGVERLAFTVSGSSGDPGLAVYLRRGPVLLGLYFPDATAEPMPVEGRTTIPAIVALFEERLLQRGGGSASGGTSGGPAA